MAISEEQPALPTVVPAAGSTHPPVGLPAEHGLRVAAHKQGVGGADLGTLLDNGIQVAALEVAHDLERLNVARTPEPRNVALGCIGPFGPSGLCASVRHPDELLHRINDNVALILGDEVLQPLTRPHGQVAGCGSSGGARACAGWGCERVEVAAAQRAGDNMIVAAVPGVEGDPHDHVVGHRLPDQCVEAGRGHAVHLVECEEQTHAVRPPAGRLIDHSRVTGGGHDRFRAAHHNPRAGGVTDFVANKMDGAVGTAGAATARDGVGSRGDSAVQVARGLGEGLDGGGGRDRERRTVGRRGAGRRGAVGGVVNDRARRRVGKRNTGRRAECTRRRAEGWRGCGGRSRRDGIEAGGNGTVQITRGLGDRLDGGGGRDRERRTVGRRGAGRRGAVGGVVNDRARRRVGKRNTGRRAECTRRRAEGWRCGGWRFFAAARATSAPGQQQEDQD